jgi:uncharacterized coiled-coil DUF342 family protein
MKISKSDKDSSARTGKLRNFDLTVEEIKILKTIKDMTKSLEDIKGKNDQPVRFEYFRSEIKRLEGQLEEIRENTLIR